MNFERHELGKLVTTKRDEITAEDVNRTYDSVLASLLPGDQLNVEIARERVVRDIEKMGVSMSFELIFKLGMYLAGEDEKEIRALYTAVNNRERTTDV